MAIQIGIIGCGGIAKAHIKAYQDANAEIAAVTDIDSEVAHKLAGVLTNARVFADSMALIQSGIVEAVSICTPPVAHEEAAIQALKHGVHVLCEKPMAYNAGGAQRMAEAAKESEALLMPAFRHRFLPAVKQIRQLMQDKEIGDVVLFNNIFCGPAFSMEGRWFTKKAVAGGGSLLDTNSHSVDLFRFIVGEIVEQNGVMHRHFKSTDVEDAGILTVEALNGALGTLQSSFVAGCGAAFIDIIGTRGRILFNYSEANIVQILRLNEDNWKRQEVIASNGFSEEITHFLAAIKGDTKLTCTAFDGVRTAEVIEAVYTRAASF